jgi:hypothetical protein
MLVWQPWPSKRGHYGSAAYTRLWFCGVSARLPSAEARAWQGDADEPERDGTAQVSIGAVRQRILTPSEARALRRRRLRRPDALMRHQARDADTRHVARSGVLDQRVFSLV